MPAIDRLKNTFDTVDHKILLKKLNHYGIRGIAQSWFHNYLKNRKQCVQINNVKSNINSIDMGVPQGSVLGPILFLLYINDIPNVISNESVKTILFADDTCIYLSGKNANDLKELATNTMYELQEWFSLNRLTLNLDKTHFCIFHSPRKKIQPNYNDITIGNQKITRMNGIPYLGVNLDETLTWKNHTKYLTEQLIKTASSFKLIKNYIPHKGSDMHFNGAVPKLIWVF